MTPVRDELEIKAVYDNPQAKVTITVTGFAREPQLEMSSTPPMDQDQIAFFLATGRIQGRATQQGGHGHGVMFLGTEGWVHVDRSAMDAKDKSLLKAKIGPNEVQLFKSDNHHVNFIDAVKGRVKPVAPIDIAVRTDTLCHLQQIAVKLGRKIRWDAAQEAFVNDEEATRMLDRPMRSPWKL